MFIGTNIAKIIIPAIDLNKSLIVSSDGDLQKNIDLNNLVTRDSVDAKLLIIYGHYTQIKSYVLNRIYELKQNDEIELVKNKKTSKYRIIEMGKFKDFNEINKPETTKMIVIITCTKTFSKSEKYYVKARLI